MNGTNDPSEPGTVPKVETFSGLDLSRLAKSLTFTNRGPDQNIPPGPLGQKSEDRIDAANAPRLGYAGFPQLRTLRLRSDVASPFSWVPYVVQRPCVILPIRTTIPAATTGTLILRYAPGSSAQTIVGADVNSRHGFRSVRCACHLFAAGRWFLSLGGAADTLTVDFVEIPCEDRTMAEQLLASTAHFGEGLRQVATVVLPAATATNVLELRDVLFFDFVRVVNAGANPLRLKWSGTPTAADGFGIASGAFLDFPPETLSVSRLRGFSTAGTTAEVWANDRNWSA